MGTKRGHIFVLLFVLGLIAVSALVIANKPTRLGLDLKGGVELVYQGEPTGQVKTVTGEDIERSIEIIRERIDKLGVAEPEVSRLGTTEISVSLPDVTNAQRAIDQVGTTAQLYFFDWEPNLIGPEQVIGGHPGKEFPPGPVKKLDKEWEAAGRNIKTNKENQRLVLSGAFPNAYGAVKLASEQPPVENCETCSAGKPRYYLFSEKEPHELLAGPELTEKDLYVTPTGKKRPHKGIVLEVPVGTIVVSELPQDEKGQVDQTAEPGWYALKDNPALSGTDITNPEEKTQETGPAVTFEFTGDGRQAFQDVTRRIAQRGQASAIGPKTAEEAGALSGHFAVILDNEVKTRPIINFSENPDGIDGRTGAQISGGFNSISEAQDLATILQIGALPIDLKLISQTQVSATLGSQALHAGIKAGIIGLALVVLFLLLFYRFLGLIASVALGAYGVIFFALIKLIPITLTLPGIAGLVLTIGVAADSNIVIFERIKEEVRAGRSMSSAIAAGYKRGIATIVDANVVTLLTAFILFVLATAGVKGFAFVLGIGTIVSLLTAVVFTQALLGTMSRSRFLRSPSVLGASRQGLRWHFDFMGASRWFFTMSGIILLVGALALATKQLNFGIDFESGTRVKVALVKPTDEEGVRGALDTIGVSGEEVQQVSDPVFGKNVFQIQTRELGPSQVKDAERVLSSEFGIAENGFDSTSVGPTFGAAGGQQRPQGPDLLAARDLWLRGAALRPEVRGAGPDRPLPRHPDHSRHLLPDRAGGVERNGRRLPHHLGLFALRHDHRLRPHSREHAAHAAGGVLADRQPLDERGADAVAGDELHHPAGDCLAADLRRRDAAGFRLRDAGRDRLWYLLVDLHRFAGVDRLEGTRARLCAPPSPHRRGRGHGCRLSPTRSSWPGSATTPRATRRSPRARRTAGGAAEGRRGRDGRAEQRR